MNSVEKNVFNSLKKKMEEYRIQNPVESLILNLMYFSKGVGFKELLGFDASSCGKFRLYLDDPDHHMSLMVHYDATFPVSTNRYRLDHPVIKNRMIFSNTDRQFLPSEKTEMIQLIYNIFGIEYKETKGKCYFKLDIESINNEST